MTFSKGNLQPWHRWAVALMILLPLLVAAFKWDALPTADTLQKYISLTELSPKTHDRLAYVLFVPLGAILIVLCRLTLGIRVLGPFRSILLAVAFQFTGIVSGLLFLAIVIGAVVAIRPLLKAMRLPYFGRVSVLLSLISVIIIATILIANSIQSEMLQQVAHFPIVVLCLMGDAFARTLTKEGAASALWRGTTTAGVAVLIATLAHLNWLRQLLLAYPELLILQVGLVIVISEYLDFRLFRWLNPELRDGQDTEREDTVFSEKTIDMA